MPNLEQISKGVNEAFRTRDMDALQRWIDAYALHIAEINFTRGFAQGIATATTPSMDTNGPGL